MKTTNEIRSKVMKAAWKTFSKRSKWSFSACLKSAWKWAKETLMQEFTIWMPKSDFGRAYFGQNYIQFSIKERSAKGAYESHRACKGESYAIAYFKLIGISLDEVKPFFYISATICINVLNLFFCNFVFHNFILKRDFHPLIF